MEYQESIERPHFRQEVREWLHAHKPRDRRPDGTEEQSAYDRAWQLAQFDGGWAGIGWPKEYGGQGLSPGLQLIWAEEYAAAHCPVLLDSCWLGINHAGPTLIARGTEAQKRFHLPRILKGESTWSQGFSEPNAGSDMASLRTRATIDGECLVVNGQKTWSSFAHLSDYQELLVRTGSPESRHRGLTWVICALSTPGVRVRPIRALTGRYHNCEIFFDNVRIPLANIVGRLNDGWSTAMTTFLFERGSAMFGRLCELVVALEDLIALARTRPAISDVTFAVEHDATTHRLGYLRAQAQSLRAVTYLMAAASQHEFDLGAEGAILHLPFSELAQAVCRCALELLGPRSLSRSAGAHWVGDYLEAFSHTIAGGTSEIHRSIIGERLLGLPR